MLGRNETTVLFLHKKISGEAGIMDEMKSSAIFSFNAASPAFPFPDSPLVTQ